MTTLTQSGRQDTSIRPGDHGVTKYAFDNPHSDIVALHGGPSHGRWYFYRDWLALRRSSRLGRYPLSRPCGTPRCYAPTHTFVPRTDGRDAQMQARAWQYVPPEQWDAWGREYLTPEEQAPNAITPAPQGDVTGQLWPDDNAA